MCFILRLTFAARKPVICFVLISYCFFFKVCGFEAFINGKHIIGEVKEKEQAHKEYKRAINEGHGAYLMDEETPVSSVSLVRDRLCQCVTLKDPGLTSWVKNTS